MGNQRAQFCEKYGPWVVITGASSGIGAEFSMQLCEAGLNIAMVARRKERMDELAALMRSRYSRMVMVIEADLSTEEGWRKVLTQSEYLDVGLLVANAGREQIGALLRDEVEKHIELNRLNCEAVLALTHGFGRRLVERGRGGMILTSSMEFLPCPWSATYCASKAFARSLSLALATEMREKGVQVLSLQPGLVDTELTKRTAKWIDRSKLPWCSKPQQVETCVATALKSLIKGKTQVTPGFKNGLNLFFMTSMPTSLRLRYLDRAGRRSMDRSLLDLS